MWGSSGSGEAEEHDESTRESDHVVVAQLSDALAEFERGTVVILSIISRLDSWMLVGSSASTSNRSACDNARST